MLPASCAGVSTIFHPGNSLARAAVALRIRAVIVVFGVPPAFRAAALAFEADFGAALDAWLPATAVFAELALRREALR
jgi:hypothetical protein